jgi:hypothetical protein
VKWTVKLLLCFLIAWLPFTGYAAQASLCQSPPSIVAVNPGAAAQTHTALAHAYVAHAGDSSAMRSQHDQAVCHAGGVGTSCGNIAAIPADLPMPVPSRGQIAYATHDYRLRAQFIPDTPQRPPQLL